MRIHSETRQRSQKPRAESVGDKSQLCETPPKSQVPRGCDNADTIYGPVN